VELGLGDPVLREPRRDRPPPAVVVGADQGDELDIEVLAQAAVQVRRADLAAAKGRKHRKRRGNDESLSRRTTPLPRHRQRGLALSRRHPASDSAGLAESPR
jgi:hypothetical protein